MNYSPFIYAFEQENIAITGDGTLDGRADAHWWPWRTEAIKLVRHATGCSTWESGCPGGRRVFGDGQ
jgi:hypothetical protein